MATRAPDGLQLIEQIGEGDRVDVHTREGVENIDHPLLSGSTIGVNLHERLGVRRPGGTGAVVRVA